MNATAKAPTGMALMLKSLGVDPAIFDQVANAVKAIAGSLERIEANQKKILALLAPEGTNGDGQ
jgi:hypothetical protein